MATIQPDKVLRIDEDVIKGFLTTAIAAADYSLEDPESTNRPSKSAFVTTYHPTRPVHFPIVVIEILSASGQRLSRFESLFQHEVTIRFLTRAKVKTHCHNIINGIAEIFNRRHRALSEAGFADSKITGASSITWDSATQTYTRTLSVQGLVFSDYTAP